MHKQLRQQALVKHWNGDMGLEGKDWLFEDAQRGHWMDWMDGLVRCRALLRRLLSANGRAQAGSRPFGGVLFVAVS